MSLGTTSEWLDGISIGNGYLDSLSISHFNTSASITKYWQGMISDLMYFLVWICLRTYCSLHHYEFRNYRGVAGWYKHWQLVSRQFKHITLQYKCSQQQLIEWIAFYLLSQYPTIYSKPQNWNNACQLDKT